MIDDAEALLAHMYFPEEEDDEPEDKPKVERPNAIMNMPAMSLKIRQFETLVAEQEKTIAAQARLIKRLDQRLRNVERHVGTMGKTINTMSSDLDNKIDRRGD